MKKLMMLMLFIGFSIYSYATYPVHIDSLRIVKTDDTTFLLAVYGVHTPQPPCTILDSSKYIGSDSIRIYLCYAANGSLTINCKASDSIYLGNLINSSYIITLNVTVTRDLDDRCDTNIWGIDTFQLTYSTVGINEIDFSSRVNVFPNPVSNRITITNTEGSMFNTKLTLSNSSGSTIMQTVLINPGKNEIDVSDLPAGLYFLSLQDERGRVIRRFVKE